MIGFTTWKRVAADLFIILVIALIPLLWFSKGYMVTGQDAAYPLNIMENFRSRLYTWNGQEPFGRDYSYDMGSITIHGIEAGFKFLGFTLFDAQKLTFIFWFFAMALSMYYCAVAFRKYIPYRYFPLIAAVVYSVNFYLLAIWRQGAGTSFSAYTALPLLASFYIRILTGDLAVVPGSLLFSFTLFFLNAGGGLSIPLFGGTLLVIGTSSVYFFLLNIRRNFWNIVRRLALTILLIFIFSLWLHAYWLLPFMSFAFINYHASVATQVVLSGAKAWMDSVSGYTSMINLFRLQGFPDWYNNATHSYSGYFLGNPVLIIGSFLFPVLSYVSLLIVKSFKERRFIVLFVFISLVALFFSAGTHKPTGYLMGLIVDYVPGFSIFRSAQYKFVSALYFSFALLISYTISSCIETWKKQTALRFFAAMAVIALIIIYHFPYFQSTFFVWSKPLSLMVKVPDYVNAFKSWSDSGLSGDARLFIFPRLNSAWKSEAYTWNLFSPYSFINLVTDKPVVENVGGLEQAEPIFVNRVYSEILNGNTVMISRLMSLLQTPFALLRGDAFYSLNWMPAESPTRYQKALQATSGVKKIWQSGAWEVYQLPVDQNFSGRIFGIDGLTEYIGSTENIIGTIVAGTNNFVWTTDLQSSYLADVRSKLQVPGALYAMPCTSCIFESTVPEPDIPFVRLLPGSTFYFLKQWKEAKLDSAGIDAKQRMNNRLGLTMVRIGELKALIEQDKSANTIALTGRTLSEYWDYINSMLQIGVVGQGNDYSFIQTIKGDVSYEHSVLLSLYDSNRTNNEAIVQETIAVALVSMQRVSDRINSFVASVDWANAKEYKVPSDLGVSELFVDALSLGTPMRIPSTVSFSNTTYPVLPVVSGDKVSLGVFNLSKIPEFTLGFPAPSNVLSATRIVKDNFPVWGQSCVVGDIMGYDWQKKYHISLEMVSTQLNDAQFFLRKKNIVDADQASLAHYGVANVPFSLKQQEGSAVKDFYVDGSDGDEAATLYLCSSQIDPATIIKRMTVNEVIQPVVYAVPVAKSLLYTPPRQVPFTRINPTKYIIAEGSGSYPQVIVFNERFNPGWRLYFADADRKRSWPWEKAFWTDLPYNPHHFRIYGYANAWYIDPSVKGNMVLEYYPQVLYYRGIVISLIGLVIVCSIGGIYIWNARRNYGER